MTMPPSQVEKPGRECPPPRTATIRCTHHVSDAGAADDQRRPPVVGAVPDRARLVVALVGGPDELAAQALLELDERRVAEHVGGGRFCGHVFELLAGEILRTRSTLPGGT
jgi:hypothetical protein